MTTNIINFSKDLQLWNGIASSFRDIYAEANSSDLFEWHVTISKFVNGSEYKFHFMVFWHNGWFVSQPKICLLFGQRCMIKSSNLFGNWLMLDESITTFSITAVLLGLKNIVRRINVNNINVNEFNSHNCIYCHYAQKQQIIIKTELNNNKLIEKDNNTGSNSVISNSCDSNLSVSNSSMISLTVSNCTNVSVDTQIDTSLETNNKEIYINLETKINDHAAEILSNITNIQKTQKHNEPIVLSTSNDEKYNKISNNEPELTSNNELIDKIHSVTAKNNNLKAIPKVKLDKPLKNNKKILPRKTQEKNNKKIQEKGEEKEAFRFLEVDQSGMLVWKWTEGKRPEKPNQSISISSSSTSCRWGSKS